MNETEETIQYTYNRFVAAALSLILVLALITMSPIAGLAASSKDSTGNGTANPFLTNLITAPDAPTISSVQQKKTTLTVKWKAVNGAAGYEVSYASNSKFKDAKTETVTDTSVKLTKLTRGKTWYVRVRAYRNVWGSTVYSDWSKSKHAKIPPKGIRDLDASKKMIALTFDDGPYTKVDTRILKVLKKYDGVATFFVVGNRVSTYASSVEAAYDQGCEIANHTWDHEKSLTRMSTSAMKKSIKKCNNAVKDVIGKNPTLVRPVGGSYNDTVKSTLNYPLILWSVDTLDWSSRDADSVYQKVIGHVQDGDIVLMHDLYPSTASAVEKMVPKLVEQGYQLVTVDELAYYKGVTLKAHSVYSSIR